MEHFTEVFVGIDVAKARNAIAVADGERGGEVRYLGEFDADEVTMRRVVKWLAAKHDYVHFCYEAGPTGYGLCRLIHSMGYECSPLAEGYVVADDAIGRFSDRQLLSNILISEICSPWKVYPVRGQQGRTAPLLPTRELAVPPAQL